MAALAAMTGCDVGDPDYQSADTPPMQLVEVRATTDLDDDYQPIQQALDPAGTSEVLTTTSFVARFDRFVLPSTAIRQALCVQSDLSASVQSFEDCKDPVFLEPTYNPVRREVIYRQRSDQPRLSPGTRYVMTVLPPASDDAPTGFRAFDRAPLSQRTRIEFSTVAQDPPQAILEQPPGGDLYCARDPECLSACGDDACRSACLNIGVAGVFAGCTGPSCHQDYYSGAELVQGAAAGLSLETADFILATAVNRVAHQTQTGEHADEGDRSPLRFGRAMPILDPGNPGNSYALYKIAIGLGSPNDAEIARLKASVVVGLPMPPSGGTTADQADLVSAWIAQGAVPRDCSQPPFN